MFATKRTGYSGKPLYQKLGLKPGQPIFTLHAPRDYETWLELPENRPSIKARLGKNEAFIHAFFEDAQGLVATVTRLAAALAKDGMLWVSWRKGIKGGLKEDAFRDWALAHGMVDVKVCSVSEEWSGLKLVWRKENR